jgi:enoyl-CoA hydratase
MGLFLLLSGDYRIGADAAAGGLVDRVVPPEQLDKAALEAATALRTLDLDAHAVSKLRAREQATAALGAAIEADYAALRRSGRLA